MAEKKSFRDTILIVFVVLVCFGLTIYGIVYLMGKVVTPKEETITNDVITPKVITDPNDGAVMNYGDNATTDVDTKAVVPEKVTSMPEKAPVTTNKAPVEKPVTKKAEQKQPAKQPAKQVEKKPVTKKAEQKQPAKQVEKKPAPAVAVADAPKVAQNEQPATSSQGKFVLQLMALRSEPDAYTAVDKYKNICPDIYVAKVDLKENGIWYRVRCGVTDSMDEALVLKTKFATDFKINADIIKNK